MVVRMDRDRAQFLKDFLQGLVLIIVTTGAIALALAMLNTFTFQLAQAP
jgi:hypothetical protein